MFSLFRPETPTQVDQKYIHHCPVYSRSPAGNDSGNNNGLWYNGKHNRIILNYHDVQLCFPDNWII